MTTPESADPMIPLVLVALVPAHLESAATSALNILAEGLRAYEGTTLFDGPAADDELVEDIKIAHANYNRRGILRAIGAPDGKSRAG